MQQLDHQTSEPLEGTRNTDRGGNLDQDALGRVDVNLEFAGLVDGRIEQSKETLVSMISMLNADSGRGRVVAPEVQSRAVVVSNLVSDIGTGITNVSVHLAHDSNMLVAVEQRVLLLPLNTVSAGASMRGLVCLETGVGQNDNQSLRVLVCRGNRDILLGDQLRQSRRRKRLCA